MEHKCCVSIIVPVYNVEKYLPKCMETLTGQTLRDIEIILVDDGSPDKSGELCDTFAISDSRIKVIHKKNAGLGFARNSGLEIATGEYVGFVDSDDFVSLEMFEKLYQAAIKCEADYVRCENIVVDENGNELEGSVFDIRAGEYKQDEMRTKLLFPMLGKGLVSGKEDYCGVSVWRAIYRRSIIENNNIRFQSEKEVISEDIPFNLDFLVKANKAFVIKETLYRYVMRGGSLTKTFRKDRFGKEVILNKYLVKKVKEYGLYEECNDRLKRMFLDRTRRYIGSLLKNDEYSIKEKRVALSEILNDSYYTTVFEGFSIGRLPIKYKIIAYVMKYKCVTMLLLMKDLL